MTSANVVEYIIYNKQGKQVGRHRQNVMCSTCHDGLEKFKPVSDFTIEAWGYDEEEDLWVDEKRQNLQEWMLKNPASFTHRVFQPQDKVKVNKRRGEGTVVETIKDKWFHKYKVQLLNEEVIEVQQNELMPL